VGAGLALLVRRAEADLGLADDQRRAAVGLLRFGQRRVAEREVVGVRQRDHPPAVGGEPRPDVFGEGEAGLPFDGDVVVIVEDDQLVELEVPGQRRRFGGDAFHHAAVAGDDVDLVVGQPGLVEPGLRREMTLGDRHADGGGEPGAERPGGDVDARGVAEFGMARRLALPLAEIHHFFDRKTVVEEVQQRIFQHRTVSGGEHETVAADPRRILRIVAHVLVPEGHGVIRAAQRHAGMTRFRLLDGFRRKHPDGIGGEKRLLEIVHLLEFLSFSIAELEI